GSISTMKWTLPLGSSSGGHATSPYARSFGRCASFRSSIGAPASRTSSAATPCSAGSPRVFSPTDWSRSARGSRLRDSSRSVGSRDALLDHRPERAEELELERLLRRVELGLDDLAVVDFDARSILDLQLEDLDVLTLSLPVVLAIERHLELGGRC